MCGRCAHVRANIRLPLGPDHLGFSKQCATVKKHKQGEIYGKPGVRLVSGEELVKPLNDFSLHRQEDLRGCDDLDLGLHYRRDTYVPKIASLAVPVL